MSDRIVADHLKLISTGELSEGEAVPAESALCASYGVSRSVVREAVRSLAAKGFLIASQGSATLVAPRNQWNVLDPVFLAVTSGREYFDQLQEARELFEPRMAQLAAQRITPDEVAMLAELEQRAEGMTDPLEHAELDLAFHALIATATRNAVVSSLHGMIAGLGHRTRSAAATVPGAIERATFWHQQVLAALRAGDASAAESAMALHIRQVHDDIRKFMETENDAPAAASDAASEETTQNSRAE
jgi:DNA-binding FadR family transcriptional regulator